MHVKIKQQRCRGAMSIAGWNVKSIMPWGGCKVVVRDVNCALQQFSVWCRWLCSMTACGGYWRLEVSPTSLA